MLTVAATVLPADSHEFRETIAPRQRDPSLLRGQHVIAGGNRFAAADSSRSSDESRHERIEHIVRFSAPSPILLGESKPVGGPLGKITHEPGPNC